MKTGELYVMHKGIYGHKIVIYIRKDERYANQHWVIMPDGSQESVWAGHLSPMGEQDETEISII